MKTSLIIVLTVFFVFYAQGPLYASSNIMDTPSSSVQAETTSQELPNELWLVNLLLPGFAQTLKGGDATLPGYLFLGNMIAPFLSPQWLLLTQALLPLH